MTFAEIGSDKRQWSEEERALGVSSFRRSSGGARTRKWGWRWGEEPSASRKDNMKGWGHGRQEKKVIQGGGSGPLGPPLPSDYWWLCGEQTYGLVRTKTQPQWPENYRRASGAEHDPQLPNVLEWREADGWDGASSTPGPKRIFVDSGCFRLWELLEHFVSPWGWSNRGGMTGDAVRRRIHVQEQSPRIDAGRWGLSVSGGCSCKGQRHFVRGGWNLRVHG